MRTDSQLLCNVSLSAETEGQICGAGVAYMSCLAMTCCQRCPLKIAVELGDCIEVRHNQFKDQYAQPGVGGTNICIATAVYDYLLCIQADMISLYASLRCRKEVKNSCLSLPLLFQTISMELGKPTFFLLLTLVTSW